MKKPIAIQRTSLPLSRTVALAGRHFQSHRVLCANYANYANFRNEKELAQRRSVDNRMLRTRGAEVTLEQLDFGHAPFTAKAVCLSGEKFAQSLLFGAVDFFDTGEGQMSGEVSGFRFPGDVSGGGFDAFLEGQQLIRAILHACPQDGGRPFRGKSAQAAGSQFEGAYSDASVCEGSLQLWEILDWDGAKKAKGEVDLFGWGPADGGFGEQFLQFALDFAELFFDRFGDVDRNEETQAIWLRRRPGFNRIHSLVAGFKVTQITERTSLNVRQ